MCVRASPTEALYGCTVCISRKAVFLQHITTRHKKDMNTQSNGKLMRVIQKSGVKGLGWHLNEESGLRG